ncbi:MAG: hypothetical protein WA194_02310 [Patescibacteria group bacterium]
MVLAFLNFRNPIGDKGVVLTGIEESVGKREGSVRVDVVYPPSPSWVAFFGERRSLAKGVRKLIRIFEKKRFGCLVTTILGQEGEDMEPMSLKNDSAFQMRRSNVPHRSLLHGIDVGVRPFEHLDEGFSRFFGRMPLITVRTSIRVKGLREQIHPIGMFDDPVVARFETLFCSGFEHVDFRGSQRIGISEFVRRLGIGEVSKERQIAENRENGNGHEEEPQRLLQFLKQAGKHGGGK